MPALPTTFTAWAVSRIALSFTKTKTLTSSFACPTWLRKQCYGLFDFDVGCFIANNPRANCRSVFFHLIEKPVNLVCDHRVHLDGLVGEIDLSQIKWSVDVENFLAKQSNGYSV